MQPTNNVGYLLQHLAGVLARQFDQVLRERLGIGIAQFNVLMTLQDQPNVLQKHIATTLNQTEASVSRQIKLLIKIGYLEIITNPSNRREHIAHLTAKGLRITEKALEILNEYHAPMLKRLNKKQQVQILEMLNIMYDFVS
ncbi:winged helix-turn-helix transcriptional regulator [Candidatus Saccharibacteria bacterium]|nr:winged helix-turn-helix transcriptional regulator [Candidatus Saccharibacteria bacterium]MBI3338253.1 winged helix-turn-helix transcriptional regulator [Candidatus Saccharibacteria bacterium]